MRYRATSSLVAAALMTASGPVHAKPKPPAAAPPVAAPTPSPPTGSAALMRATSDQVRARLGDPDAARAEGRGALYTYRNAACVLFVFFRDEGSGLQMSGVESGPVKRGRPVLDPEACFMAVDAAHGGAGR